jgi:biotin carboxyl carrier protein
MPGRVVKVAVRVGDIVTAGAGLLSIEAMKMENEVQAPCDGRVVRVAVEAGTTVEADQELILIESEPVTSP